MTKNLQIPCDGVQSHSKGKYFPLVVAGRGDGWGILHPNGKFYPFLSIESTLSALDTLHTLSLRKNSPIETVLEATFNGFPLWGTPLPAQWGSQISTPYVGPLPVDLMDDDQNIDFVDPPDTASCGTCRNSPYATMYPKCGMCTGPSTSSGKYQPL